MKREKKKLKLVCICYKEKEFFVKFLEKNFWLVDFEKGYKSYWLYVSCR